MAVEGLIGKNKFLWIRSVEDLTAATGVALF